MNSEMHRFSIHLEKKKISSLPPARGRKENTKRKKADETNQKLPRITKKKSSCLSIHPPPLQHRGHVIGAEKAMSAHAQDKKDVSWAHTTTCRNFSSSFRSESSCRKCVSLVLIFLIIFWSFEVFLDLDVGCLSEDHFGVGCLKVSF